MKKAYILTILVACLFVFGLFIFGYEKGIIKRTINEQPFTDYKCPDCNVVLISIDTLRADHLPCYGYEKNTTQNICRFAENSVLFENAYSHASNTIPSLRAIMSGKTVSNPDARWIVSFYEKQKFLAELLNETGYLTAGFTDNYALGNTPDSKKDRSVSMLMRGFDYFVNEGTTRFNVTSNVLTDDVTKWLDENHEKKMFLWVHYMDPHFNYNPLPEFESKFGFSNKTCGRVTNGYDIVEIRKVVGNLTEDEIDCLISLYDAEISYTDEYIGKVLDKINSLGLDNKTLVIITADHGEEFRERTMIDHGFTVYNEVTHVPLIIKYPSMHYPVRISDNIGTKSIFDIIVASIKAQKLNLDDDIISRTYCYEACDNKTSASIISGKYKYIYSYDGEPEQFFNLADDPGERNNIEKSDAKEKLRSKLQGWIMANNYSAKPPSKKSLEAEKETDERLRSLGYIN